MITDKQIQEAAEKLIEESPALKLTYDKTRLYTHDVVIKLMCDTAKWMQSQSQWIPVSERLPELIEGYNFSENVWGWVDGSQLVMSLSKLDGELVWCNCYCDIGGEGIFDDNYNVSH